MKDIPRMTKSPAPKGILKPPTKNQNKFKTGRKSAKLRAVQRKNQVRETSKNIDRIVKQRVGSGGARDDASKEPQPKKQNRKGVKRKFSAGGKDKDDGAKKPALESMSYKERKGVRRMMKNNYDISMKIKKVWEEARESKCSEEKRKTLITELCNNIKGKVADLVFAHDTVRVIQCCVQYGSQEQRESVFEEIRAAVVQLCKSKFGKFYVIKMLRYGTKEQRQQIIASFYGKVCQLVRNKDAAEVVEESYNNFANAEQRSALMEEFYGPRFAVFKEPGVHMLDEILAKNPEMKQGIIEHMMRVLTPMVENLIGFHFSARVLQAFLGHTLRSIVPCQELIALLGKRRTVVKHSIVHKALLDFMVHANNEQRAELIECLRDVVIQILHTQDGARAAMYALWFGSTKDRKIILKTFKTHLMKMCKEEYGHKVLFALFDCVDDTKLVEKAIINEIMLNCKEISEDTYGKRVILYMIAPRDPSHFHPDIVRLLEIGDNNPFSKKNTALRQQEIRAAASKPLLHMITDNISELVFDKSRSQLALAILQHTTGDKTEAYEAVAAIAADDFLPAFTDSSAITEMHIVESPSGHLFLKRLINHEKTQKSTESPRFSEVLINAVPAGDLQRWTKVNRGSLVMLSLLENGSDTVREHIRENIDVKLLEKQGNKGATALAEKLKGLKN